MIPDNVHGRFYLDDIPRASGDDPTHWLAFMKIEEYSPRERG